MLGGFSLAAFLLLVVIRRGYFEGRVEENELLHAEEKLDFERNKSLTSPRTLSAARISFFSNVSANYHPVFNRFSK